jgi:hypothetical protein
MTHLQEFDEAVRLLADAGRSRDQIARELECTYWKVRKSIDRLGIPVAEGKRGRRQTRNLGDPEYAEHLRQRAARKRKDKTQEKGLPFNIFD